MLSWVDNLSGLPNILLTLVGSAGLLKLLSIGYTKYIDRRMKLDEYAHQGSGDFVTRVWVKLEAQEKIIQEQNLEIDKKNEQIFDIKLRAELLERKCEDMMRELNILRNQNTGLIFENEQLRQTMTRNNLKPPPLEGQ